MEDEQTNKSPGSCRLFTIRNKRSTKKTFSSLIYRAPMKPVCLDHRFLNVRCSFPVDLKVKVDLFHEVNGKDGGPMSCRGFFQLFERSVIPRNNVENCIGFDQRVFYFIYYLPFPDCIGQQCSYSWEAGMVSFHLAS